MRTQLIGVVRDWENGEGVKVLGLKEEMGCFEKRVGMRESEREGEVVSKSIASEIRQRNGRDSICDVLINPTIYLFIFIRENLFIFMIFFINFFHDYLS